MNWNAPIRWGLIGGLVSVVISVLIYIISPSSFASMWLGLVILGLALFFMIWGGVAFRRENNDEITFLQALGAVLIIGVIISLLSTIFSYILFNFIDTDLAELIKQKVMENTTEMMEKFGATDEDIEKALEKIEEENFQFGLKEYAIRFLQGMGFYAVMGLIVAAFVKRNPENKVLPNAE